jgi:hypothetical protein
VARRSVWADDEVQELLRSFVLAADEVGRLQRGDDAECRAFQGFCEQGHYGGRSQPTGTRQGIYALAPSGAFLSSCNTHSPKHVARMLREALARWQELSPEQRALPDEQREQIAATQRFVDRYPEDGLVLAEYLRDLDRAVDDDWRTRAWNEDQVWFTRAEVQGLVPERLDVGAGRDVPRRLVERLVCLHLVDSVRGQTPALPRAAVTVARLASEVVAVDDLGVHLRLTGETRAEQRGRWVVPGAPDDEERVRGVATTLAGRAVWNRDTGRFVSFELVAIGERWGATQYNERSEDLAPSKIGFAFVLAAEGQPRVAPAFYWDYRLDDGAVRTK